MPEAAARARASGVTALNYGSGRRYLNAVFPRWRDISAPEHAGWNAVCLGQWGGTLCRQMREDAAKANLSGVSDAMAREALLKRNLVHLSPLGIACAEDIHFCDSAKISGRPRSQPQPQPPRSQSQPPRSPRLCPLFVAVREAWTAALARAFTARARRSCERRMHLHLEETLRKAEASYAARMARRKAEADHAARIAARRQRGSTRPVGRVGPGASAHHHHHQASRLRLRTGNKSE